MNNLDINKIIKYGLIALFVFIVILLFRSCGSDKAKLELKGDEQVIVYQNRRYVDPGYTIVDASDTSGYYINIDGYVNINKVGAYYLLYSLYNKIGNLVSTANRTVIVIEDKYSDITMILKGEDEEYYFVNDYIDQGVEVYSGSNEISDEINIDSDVRSDTIGSYTIKYQMYNGSLIKEAVRKVNIVDYNLVEDIDYINMTINFDVDVANYDYTLMPDKTKNYSRYISYPFEDIGDYVFEVYLKSGSHKKYSISIDNIDHDGPVGSCTLYHTSNKTTITMNVTDSSGISRYNYNGLDFYSNSTTINAIASNVTVRAYDKRNNYTDIKCKSEYGTAFRTIELYENGRPKNKNGSIKCGTSVTKENLELEALMESYGYKTREAVAAAGFYLASYKYEIPYFWGGKYMKKGLNPEWGCRHTVYGKTLCTKQLSSNTCEWGLDCTGLTSWAFVQAGFDPSIIRESDQSTSNWGNFSARNHRYTFSSNNRYYIDQIRPGDLVHREGHVGLVIGVDKDTIQIVEMLGPIFVSTIDKNTGRGLTGQKGFTDFVLFEEFYKMYGNS